MQVSATEFHADLFHDWLADFLKQALDTGVEIVLIIKIGGETIIELVEEGPVKATYKIEKKMQLPESLADNNKSRADKYKSYRICSYISLSVNSNKVEIKTEINNKIKDHRLRVCFPADIQADYSYAGSQFDIVKRNIKNSLCKGWKEPQPSFHPQLNFVDINNGEEGLAILNQGLTEYEIKKKKKKGRYYS
mgnify:CR=1 FL=1